MRRHLITTITAGVWLLIGLCSNPSELLGITLAELNQQSNLTPQKFAKFFADFRFEMHAEVQKPEDFLARQAGDCDDYAILAAQVLRGKGYSTRLITIRMPTQTHVVCYVEETHCYLDFNSRAYLLRTTSCGNSLEEIARKVARSFGCPWNSVSEFDYQAGQKILISTQLPGGIPLGIRNQTPVPLLAKNASE